jgi:signal transduction histidine kinase
MDPLQVNLRWVVSLILLLVIVPTVLLTGFGIFVLLRWRESPGLLMGIMVTSFSASVVAGAILLLFLARRGARLARVQETFLSRMGHELLTPLAGIRLHSQILQGTNLPGDARESLEAIRRESDRLAELVERIVSWRKFRSGRHLYRHGTTTVGAVVDEVLRRVPGSTGVKARVADRDFVIQGDPEALAEALGNLLHNALKYAAQDGPVEISARRLARIVVFAVADRGPGLPPDAARDVFEPFSRFVSAERPDPGGSGLGLTIARQIVRAHGGKIAVARRRGPGLVFYFVLPAAAR